MVSKDAESLSSAMLKFSIPFVATPEITTSPGSKNSTILLRESVKNVTRKTVKEKHEAKVKAAAAKKGKK